MPAKPAVGYVPLMRPWEVAQAFGVSRMTVARWTRAGKLTPVQTPGGGRRYFADEVRALLAASEQ